MANETATDAPAQAEAIAELRSLVARAKNGDRAVLPLLRQVLDENRCLWRLPGDVAVQAQAAWVKLIAGPNIHLRECVVRRVNELKGELAGQSPIPVESLLIERVVMAWLQLAYIEAREAQFAEPNIKWAEFNLKRQAQAERQFRAAIDALETVRKATRPINVEIRQSPAVPCNAPITGVVNGETPASMAAMGSQPDGTATPVNRINGKVNGHNRLHTARKQAEMLS
jgi:hypothetical protein